MARMEPGYALGRLAEYYDQSIADDDLQINDYDNLIEGLIDILAEAGHLTSCSQHGWWANFRDNCPACEYCSNCEQSPCDCETEEEDL